MEPKTSIYLVAAIVMSFFAFLEELGMGRGLGFQRADAQCFGQFFGCFKSKKDANDPVSPPEPKLQLPEVEDVDKRKVNSRAGKSAGGFASTGDMAEQRARRKQQAESEKRYGRRQCMAPVSRQASRKAGKNVATD